MAIGAASVVAPAYIAEIAPAHLRRPLESLQQLAIVLGIFVALLGDYAIATSPLARRAARSSSELSLAMDAAGAPSPGARSTGSARC